GAYRIVLMAVEQHFVFVGGDGERRIVQGRGGDRALRQRRQGRSQAAEREDVDLASEALLLERGADHHFSDRLRAGIGDFLANEVLDRIDPGIGLGGASASSCPSSTPNSASTSRRRSPNSS